MISLTSWLRLMELDRLYLPELVQRIERAEADANVAEPRRYPGYPKWPLPRNRRRWRHSLDGVLANRRSPRKLKTQFPAIHTLGRLLQASHGITGDQFRGPAPSAGGLQAVELFVVHWQGGWLPAGVYHYDRVGHELSQLSAGTTPERWRELVPSLHRIEGGAFLWLMIGETQRVAEKYGERGDRFLLLEAGHLMQNLCLVSASVGLSTVPMGACLEREIATELRLPQTDSVLYAGVCGEPVH